MPTTQPIHLTHEEALQVLPYRAGNPSVAANIEQLQSEIATAFAPVLIGDLIAPRYALGGYSEASPEAALGTWVMDPTKVLIIEGVYPEPNRKWTLDVRLPNRALTRPDTQAWDEDWVRVEQNTTPEAPANRKYYTVALRNT